MITSDQVKNHIDTSIKEGEDVNYTIVIREGRIKRLVENRIIAGN